MTNKYSIEKISQHSNNGCKISTEAYFSTSNNNFYTNAKLSFVKLLLKCKKYTDEYYCISDAIDDNLDNNKAICHYISHKISDKNFNRKIRFSELIFVKNPYRTY